MADPVIPFAELIAPIGVEEFFATYHDKKPLFIQGAADRWRGIMSWSALDDLLSMSGVWTPTSLLLAYDGQSVAADRYCETTLDREMKPSGRPITAKVMEHWRNGATLVVNYVDTLSPGLRAVANALEQGTGARAQCNLYASRKGVQGFKAHCDRHDVYALHIEGDKAWRIYDGRFPNPIPHPVFDAIEPAAHEKLKGNVAMEIVMRPGDFLYLPRGLYHEALANSSASLHLTFGVYAALGLDFVDALREQAAHDPHFRALLPSANRPGDVRSWTDDLVRRLAAIAGSEDFQQRLLAACRGFPRQRGGYDLAADIDDAYKVSDGLAIVSLTQGFALKARDGRAVQVPPAAVDGLRWVLAQPGFKRSAFDAAFKDKPAADRAQLLRDLAAMKVIGPA